MHFPQLSLGLLIGFLICACVPSDGSHHSGPDVLVEKPIESAASLVFDFPVGAPDAKGYYNAQPFGKNNHLGDDWNGVGGGNSDLGDTVYAAAEGMCTVAVNFFGGWGKVARIQHGNAADGPESLYAHLDQMWITVGQHVHRGQAIGTIGTGEGIYLAHLHFEMRERGGMPLGGGYSVDRTEYVDPTSFIRAHRPKK